MLFNSFIFIFVFLPIVVILYAYLTRQGQIRAAKLMLIVVSLIFYMYWNVYYLGLLLLSMLVNYAISRWIHAHDEVRIKKLIMILALVFNIGLLGFFKYYNFFVSNINYIFASDIGLLKIALPLAISFFTFQQIAYQVDSYRGETREYGLIDYALFITFFPQLIAGPIVRHDEMFPQFADKDRWRIKHENIALGGSIFIMGLFKKVVLADNLSLLSDVGFASPTSLTFMESWITSVAYTLQLYFDFSGYADMAIGLALLFNIVLPLNFNSPYKAINIQEFWQRWHITLTRFLTRYLYFPLGGVRKA